MGAPAIAAVILRKEREVVDLFRGIGAISPATARSFDEVGVEQAWPLSRLRRRAIIREGAPGRYYLDEEVWTAMRGMRRRTAFVVLGFVALIGFLVWIGFVTLK
ncbi:MAG: hypothetical protein H0W63_07705 [Gemmatimonadaceae bacterium]|nr:hypothetical protein [Gemmatimonadaceae bacterium]